jgi:diguanylate cyclase (GGDEF)-like protein
VSHSPLTRLLRPFGLAPLRLVDTLETRVLELERKVTIDDRTGCYSRQYFDQAFARDARADDVLFFIDLDDFKGVNDHYGHLVGDDLIAAIGQSMRETVGQAGFVTRMAGDEFLVLLFQPTPAQADTLDRGLRKAIAKANVLVRDMSIARNASLGRIKIKSGMSPDDAIMLADQALMVAKSMGKNRSSGIDDRAISLSAKRPSLEDVRKGLQNREIGYHLQPIIDCSNSEIAGYEALLRWERPSGEVLGPAQFLDTMTAAYDARTVPPLAQARAVSDWAVHEQGKFITFNVSSSFLARAATEGLDWVGEIIGDVPRDKIVFELVETIVNREDDAISKVVADLRAKGINVALDDFGVGYSTLERLQELQVDFVKIDSRFLNGAMQSQRDADLLKGMIDITHKLRAQSVVEGVETAEEFALVKSLGAHFAQGFFLGRPEPVNATLPI